MKCACCGKKKGIFESFEEVDKNVNICVDCSKLLYKYQDFIHEGNEDETDKILNLIKEKKSNVEFNRWFEGFLSRCRASN